MAGMGFMLLLVNNVQDNQLQTSLDETHSKLFRSESARLFIQDCLLDELDTALIELSKGGRLFYPYNNLEFQDGVNGVMFEGDQVYFGITYEENEEPASYPCESSSNAPAYCQWVNTDTANFGARQKLRLSYVEDDLEQYVKTKVLDCFETQVETQPGYAGAFESGELTLSLKIESGGIIITATYPLSLTIDGDEMFEIQDFDLFYPSNLYSFFNNAIKNPLYYESRDVHYNWTEETLQSVSSYSILGATLEISDQGGYNVYEYSTNQIHRDENENLVYRVAIANRPPALEYVSQAACLGYDYLILPDSRSYTNLTINASSFDPDQDDVSFELLDDGLGLDIPGTFSEYPFINQEIEGVEDGDYELILTSFNDHGYDSQKIRVKVGETTDFDVTVTDVRGQETSMLSIEQPYLVTVSSDDGTLSSMDVLYTEGYESTSDDEIETRSFSWGTNTFCFVLPYKTSVDCDDLSNYEENMHDFFVDTIFRPTLVGETGSIELGYGESLCGESLDLSRGLSYDIVECAYQEVSRHPFPYPYHEIYVNDSGGHETRDNSPFNTTTACCIQDTNTLADVSTVCYESDVLCQNKVQVVEKAFCDQSRGNVCGSDKTIEYQRSDRDILLCADIGCGVPDVCAGQEQFSIQYDSEGTKYLCGGTYGCDQAIENPVISADKELFGHSQPWYSALQNAEVGTLSEVGIFVNECENGNWCDVDGKGTLDGVCIDGVCGSAS